MGNEKWHPFDKGSSLGTVGSESAKIIYDIEHLEGARISLEKNTQITPYAVTLGIYGLLFHTHFAKTEEAAMQFVELSKNKIEEIFLHLETPEEKQDAKWNEEYDKLKNQLCEIDDVTKK